MKLPSFKEIQLSIESDNSILQKAHKSFFRYAEKKHPKTEFMNSIAASEFAKDI